MAAARTDPADDSDGAGGDRLPPLFRQAVSALEEARPRAEIQLERMPAPRRLAPYAHALEAAVVVDGEELADGRFVLLHDPSTPDSWQGTFRVVTLARAELEPEIAADPLLPEVTWSWLTGALSARSVAYLLPSGTVTQAGSHYFGGLVERAPESQIEIRASWTPAGLTAPTVPAAGSGPPPRSADSEPATAAGTPGDRGVPEITAHLNAWCDLLCQCAGLPPDQPDGLGPADEAGGTGRVVSLPQRRGPQPL